MSRAFAAARNVGKALLLLIVLCGSFGALGWAAGGYRLLLLFGGEYQEGTLTAYCYVEDVAHIELNGHILVPLQNIALLHCSSRCDAPADHWPPRGLGDEPEDDDVS